MGTDSAEIPRLLAQSQTRHADLFLAETPRRRVSVTAFWLDRTEVTAAAFSQFLRRRPEWQRERVAAATHNGEYLRGWSAWRFPEGQVSQPVTFVTWDAAHAFCAGHRKRLPIEAEWEWAARGRLSDSEFPWGNEPPDGRANWAGAGLGRPTNVGRFPPNGYGLFDMAGNVWEFLADRWPSDSAHGATPAQTRYVIRGGSYGGLPLNLRVKYRDSHPAGAAGPHVGFRCARDF